MFKLESDFLKAFAELDNLYTNNKNLTESLTQEIGQAYKDLQNKYGLDFDELLYGVDGFMTLNYPNGFEDFNGDIIYSEKYWKEFENWLETTKNIKLEPQTDALIDFINDTDEKSNQINEDLNEVTDMNAFLEKYGFDEGFEDLKRNGYTIASKINIDNFTEDAENIVISCEVNAPEIELTWEDIEDDEVNEDYIKQKLRFVIETAFDYADTEYTWQAMVDLDSIEIDTEDFNLETHGEYRDSEGQWMPSESEITGTAKVAYPISITVSRTLIK